MSVRTETLFERVKALTEHPGPVGRGQAYNEWLRARWQGIRDAPATIRTPGNLLVKVGGHGPKVVLVAHVDEIAFSVKTITDCGALAISPAIPDQAGRPSRRMGLHVAGQSALVLGENGLVEGVFTTVTGHVTTREQSEQQVIRWRDFWVEVGCSSREACQDLGILPGTPIVWNPPTRRLGKRIVGKAMDDRAGLAILETVLSEVKPDALNCELWLAATVMEECYALGAWALCSQTQFDAAIIVDIGLSSDCPSVSEIDVPVRLGDGAVLVVKDNAVHYNIDLLRRIERCALLTGIPVQRAAYGVDGSYTSDGLRFIAHGIPTALVTFPCAYTHSPFELIDERDLRAVCDLLHTLVMNWGESSE